MLPESLLTRGLWLGAALLCVFLLLLPVFFRLDGKTHADWQQFLGRFHPIVVHLPIGLIMLVPLLEIAGYFRPAFRETAGFVLGLGCIGSVFAVMLGILLAHGSGTAGAGVTRHMWGGIALTIATLVALLARPAWAAPERSWAYPSLLGVALLLLMWAAHQGGSLTHGANYLTEYLPAPLKRLSGSSGSSGVAKDSFYAMQIHPILDANCVTCHGEGKVKGGLRLDSYELLMRGGQYGAAVVPGKPERSLLLQRVTLPTGHKLFMPAEGKPPLKPEEIALIRAWILQGASSSVATLDGVSVRAAEPALEPVGDYTALSPEIQKLQQGQGAKLRQVSSKPGDGLILATVDAPAVFGDAQLVQFERFAPYLVEVNLARTAITDQSLDTLSKFTHLRALHLEGTKITGAGLARLAPLSQLTYLNLSETKVTAAAIAPLTSMKNLRHLYLYDTPAQPVVPPAQSARTTP
jgi:uncharacterized membrane protein/mono/diheme cytochrome c family protein